MEDNEFIEKISHLKQIKPKADWVLLTRQRIIGERTWPAKLALQRGSFWGIVDKISGLVGSYVERANFAKAMLAKPAFVIPALACMVAGGAVWQSAIASLPGDTLYPLRAAVEKVSLRLSAQEDRSVREFAIAQQSLADLRIVAERNKVKNLPSAIQEFEANASKISEGFIATVEKQPEKALQASRQVVQLQKDKLEVEKILGTKIGEEQEKEVENATKRLVGYELAYLETRSLLQDQKELFEKAKTAASEGSYAVALEVIWALSHNP